jgi:predicted nucleic acid-binding protein
VGWIDSLHGSTVGLDTGPLIYYIEESPSFLPKVAPFFEAAERGEFRIVTSFITLIEVLVHPVREGRRDLAQQYRDVLLHAPNLMAIPVDGDIAEEAAKLRAHFKLRTPDAIQMATAIQSGASWFFTSDGTLPQIPGISMLVLKRLP